MSAFLIFTRDQTLSEHKLATYVKEVRFDFRRAVRPIGKYVSIVSEERRIGSHWWLESEELKPLKPLTVHP